ncbi:MAG: hypothetical protein WCH44_07610 [Betaproteobacteria bacterium]
MLEDFGRGLARAIRRLALIPLALLLLASCAQWLGPRTVLVSQTQLQQKLSAGFPVQKKLLELFRLTVEAPNLQMRPDTQRVALAWGLALHDPLGGREHRGVLTASFGLRVDHLAMTVQLVDVRVDSLQVDGLSPNVRQALTRLGRQMVAEKIEGHVVYRLQGEKLAQAEELGYSVDSLAVTPQGLAIHLIAKR